MHGIWGLAQKVPPSQECQHQLTLQGVCSVLMARKQYVAFAARFLHWEGRSGHVRSLYEPPPTG